MADLYTTIDKWRAYALARGEAGPDDAETPEKAEEALQKAEDYIRLRYFRRFAPDYATTPPSGQVATDLEEATNIAAEHELTTPGRFSTIINPAEDRELVQAGDYKWRPSTHQSTEQRVVDSVAIDSRIHDLLDRYLINPTGTLTPATGGGDCPVGVAGLGVSLGR